VLVLQGTIAIHFRGNTYQLLMDLYLTAGYPRSPPVAYVRLAPNMYLKENHKHVGSDGKVYLPYLHEWRPETHNLVELTVAMSSVFSADPPVFSRPPAPAPAATATATASVSEPPPPFSAALNSSSLGSGTYSASATYNTSSGNNWRTQQEELEAALAASAAEAAAQQAEARRREQELIEAAERESAAAAYEQAQKRQLQDALQSKLQAHFRQQSLQTLALVQEDAMDQQEQLEQTNALTQQLQYYRNLKKQLQHQCATAEQAVTDVQEWLSEARDPANANNTNNNAKKKTIDELCVPATAVARQQLALAAEIAAIQDALYFLDRALYQDQMDATSHLKQVRSLAKRQFLAKAHLLKIMQHQQ